MDAKPFWQSKTIIVNALLLLLAIAELPELSGVLDLIPGDQTPIIAIVATLANVVLRTVTNKPMRWGKASG